MTHVRSTEPLPTTEQSTESSDSNPVQGTKPGSQRPVNTPETYKIPHDDDLNMIRKVFPNTLSRVYLKQVFLKYLVTL